MKALHVNSSLPRSGSELLQALLAQHPDIYGSATSPLLEYWYGAAGNTNLPEVRSQDQALMQRAFSDFCREGARGYYEAITDKPVVVDKSRGWLQYAERLCDSFPDAKIVCMVRDPEQIVASLERIYQANPMHPDTQRLPTSAAARRQAWLAPGAFPLGLALERLRDRQAKGADSRIMYVRYGDLCASPIPVMQAVFKHIEVEPFEINPYNVEKAAPEDDSHFGIFGNHKLRPIVGGGSEQPTATGVLR